MHSITRIFAIIGVCSIARAEPIQIIASNELQRPRTNETIEIPARDLAPLGVKNLNLVHVTDAAGNEILCQAIDLDGDSLRIYDAVIFQADFAAGESKTFTLTSGIPQVFRKEQFKAFGRFARERFDDFAWENDRVAHRTYGQALETWEGEPLTSSTVDIWSKRTPRMVINDWYLTDDYHDDRGEGADFYAAGPSRGCGGSGFWAAGRLWPSRNFVNSRVLANGPIRVLFELDYAPYEVNGVKVAETKRVALDAGQHFTRYESRFQSAGKPDASVAIGLKRVPDELVETSADHGWLAKWEPVARQQGHQGLAVIVRPQHMAQVAADDLNHLVVTKPAGLQPAGWWAGFCWDKAGHFTNAADWNRHVDEFAINLATPIRVTVKRSD